MSIFWQKKSFLFKIFVNHSLKLVLGKLGKAELKLVLDQPSVPNALLDLRIGNLRKLVAILSYSKLTRTNFKILSNDDLNNFKTKKNYKYKPQINKLKRKFLCYHDELKDYQHWNSCSYNYWLNWISVFIMKFDCVICLRSIVGFLEY